MNRKLTYRVERPIYSYEELQKDFPPQEIKFNLINSIKYKTKCKKQSPTSILQMIFPLPFTLMSYYTLKFFVLDILSGLTIAIFHIPQGLAYGLLSALQPINGLYASFFPPLVYALFGTSRHISVGTFSIISLLSSVAVLRDAKLEQVSLINGTFNSTGDPTLDVAYEMAKLQISISTTLLAGILQVLFGILQFGFLMSFMSDALIEGFTSAVVLHVVMSQLSSLLGYSVTSYSGIGELPYKVYLFVKHIQQISLPTVVVSVSCIVILVLFSEFVNPRFKRKFKVPLPIQFLLVVISTVISYYSDFNKRFRIKIVGPIPRGLPYPMIPDVTIWPSVLPDAAILAIVGFAMSSSLAKIYALKYTYNVNYNQESAAYGLSNIVGSFFQCTIAAAALARTAVADEIGMKSQIASLISCLIMAFVILFIGPLFISVPKAVLSAIIVVSLKGNLLNIGNIPKLWYLSKYDFLVWIVTFSATIVLNVPLGLVAGFVFSLVTVLIRIQYPKSQILGQIPNTDIYKNIKIFRDAQEIAGIKIFRYDAPLYFANAEHFQSKVYRKTGANLSQISVARNNIEDERKDMDVVEKNLVKQQHADIKCIIIDCSSMNYIDNVGIRILGDIYKAYHKVNVKVLLAAPNYNCRDMLLRGNFAEANRNRIMFLTVHDAVLSTDIYRKEFI